MNRITISIVYLALLFAGLTGINLSVTLQAPAVIFFGASAFCLGLSLLCKREISSNSKWLPTLAILALGYFTIRAVMSPVQSLGIQDLMLILPAGILYLAAGFGLSGISGARVRQGMAWVVILLLLLHIGAALMQVSGSEGYSLSLYYTSSVAASGDSITGMYGYYGSFANFMVIAGLLCLSAAGWGRFGKALRILLCALGCVALALVVWSQSRSAAVSLIFSMVVLVILFIVSLAHQKESIRKRWNIIISALAAVGLFGVLVGGVWVFENRVHNGAEEGLEMVFDSRVRMPYWAMATEQWADYPIVGAGSRSYSYLANKYWSPNLSTDEASPEFVHNEYLQLLADYGVVGLLLILSLLVWHLILGVQRVYYFSKKVGEDGFRKGSNTMVLTIAGVCGMVAMAVHILFDFRTHLLANLLLFVCCATWVLPVVNSKRLEILKIEGHRVSKSWMSSRNLGYMLLVLGLGTIGLGGWQFFGGVPLLKGKIAKEDGTWFPQKVPRDKWIPALEESVARAPNFNRFQRLATLYQLEANDLQGASKKAMIEKAETAYLASIDYNPYNPIPWINLATIYTEEKRYEDADHAYSEAAEMAKAREQWFRMHSRWGLMQQEWAVEEIQLGNIQKAEKHFVRAKELFLESHEYGYFYHNKQWVVEYTRFLIVYARAMGHQKRFDDAELLYAEGRKQVNWVNWQKDTKMNFYYGQHLYEYGRHLWYQRKPQEAYRIMLDSRAQLIQHQKMMGREVEKGFSEQLAEVNKVIEFLEKTGIKSR